MEGQQSHQTLLMEFHVDPKVSQATTEDGLAASALQLIEKHLGQSNQVFKRHDDEMLTLIHETLPSDSHAGRSLITLRLKSSGLLLINIDLSAEDGAGFNTDMCRGFEKEMLDSLKPVKGKAICPIRRGGNLDIYRYLTSSDERILEYDVDHVVADVHSKYQHIVILNTLNFGNLLVLDDLQNLAESDLIYTETLMQRGKIDYTGKDILILGAGDGALLWELLKENPNKVTMVEIDETVMQLCRQHLRSACGTALDSYTGPHHQIIIGDCLVELDRFAESGVKFDYIFGDLTDIPLSSEPQNEEWQFLTSVISKSFKVLRPSGRFLTHGSGVSSVHSLALFESYLKNLQDPSRVQFNRCQAFVPSFMEEWVFYQVWRSNEE